MGTYNKLMLRFWLVISILIPIVVTYLCITEGFKNWGSYYVLAVLSFMMYIVRKWMMNRMEKHLKFLEEQKKK